jgi:hypothetical protein
MPRGNFLIEVMGGDRDDARQRLSFDCHQSAQVRAPEQNEELSLDRIREFGNLIEENRPAASRLEPTPLIFDSASEGSPDVTAELGFEQTLRQCGETDEDGRITSRTPFINLPAPGHPCRNRSHR